MKPFSRLLSVLVVVAAIILAACDGKPQKLAAQKDVEKFGEESGEQSLEIAEQLEDVRFSQSKGDRLQWTLEAETVEQIVDGPIGLKRIEITYYGDDERVTSVTADAGLYDSEDRNAELEGNVLVKTSDGGRIETNAIHWNQEKQTLTGDSTVTISKGDSTIRGRGFELLLTQETFKLYHVDGVLHSEDVDL